MNEPISGGELQISMGGPSGQGGTQGPQALAREILGGAANPVGFEAAEEDSIDGLRWLWDRWNDPSH